MNRARLRRRSSDDELDEDERPSVRSAVPDTDRNPSNRAVALALARLSPAELVEGAEALITALVSRLGPIALAGSVGRRGDNAADDVAAVAGRLFTLGFLTPSDQEPDGELSELTEAISRYQTEVVGLRRADGRVDPDGRTITALNAWAKEPPPAPTPEAAAPTLDGTVPAPTPDAHRETDPPEPIPERVTSAGAGAPDVSSDPASAAEPAAAPLESAGPEVASIRDDLATLGVSAKELLAASKVEDKSAVKSKEKGGRTFGQEQGPARDQLVDGIEKVRARIVALTPENTGLTTAALKGVRGQLFRAADALSPYYYQIVNADVLYGSGNTAAWRTCNVTSLSMCLEAMGKSFDDFTGDTALLEVLRVHFASALTDAADSGGGSLAEIRMPDFLQLLAVAKCFTGGDVSQPQAPEFLAAVDKARNIAMNKILQPGFFQELTGTFGVKVKGQSLFDGRMRDLIDEIGRVNRGLIPAALKASKKAKDGKSADEVKASTVAWLKNKLDEDIAAAQAKIAELEATAPPTGKAAQKKLDNQIATVKGSLAQLKSRNDADVYDAALDPEKLNSIQSLDVYSAAVEDALGRELDAGNQIVGHVYNHFIRVEGVTDDGIRIDDPGSYDRHDYLMPWPESRAIGGFTRFTVLTP